MSRPPPPSGSRPHIPFHRRRPPNPLPPPPPGTGSNGPPPPSASRWGGPPPPPPQSPSHLRDRSRDRDWERERERGPRERDLSVEDIDAIRAKQRYGRDVTPSASSSASVGGGGGAGSSSSAAAAAAAHLEPLTPRSSAWAHAAAPDHRDRDRDRNRDFRGGGPPGGLGGGSTGGTPGGTNAPGTAPASVWIASTGGPSSASRDRPWGRRDRERDWDPRDRDREWDRDRDFRASPLDSPFHDRGASRDRDMRGGAHHHRGGDRGRMSGDREWARDRDRGFRGERDRDFRGGGQDRDGRDRMWSISGASTFSSRSGFEGFGRASSQGPGSSAPDGNPNDRATASPSRPSTSSSISHLAPPSAALIQSPATASVAAHYSFGRAGDDSSPVVPQQPIFIKGTASASASMAASSPPQPQPPSSPRLARRQSRPASPEEDVRPRTPDREPDTSIAADQTPIAPSASAALPSPSAAPIALADEPTSGTVQSSTTKAEHAVQPLSSPAPVSAKGESGDTPLEEATAPTSAPLLESVPAHSADALVSPLPDLEVDQAMPAPSSVEGAILKEEPRDTTPPTTIVPNLASGFPPESTAQESASPQSALAPVEVHDVSPQLESAANIGTVDRVDVPPPVSAEAEPEVETEGEQHNEETIRAEEVVPMQTDVQLPAKVEAQTGKGEQTQLASQPEAQERAAPMQAAKEAAQVQMEEGELEPDPLVEPDAQMEVDVEVEEGEVPMQVAPVSQPMEVVTIDEISAPIAAPISAPEEIPVSALLLDTQPKSHHQSPLIPSAKQLSPPSSPRPLPEPVTSLLLVPSSPPPPPPSPPVVVVELTEEEREQQMRSVLLRLGHEFEAWQADDDDLIRRNKRLARQQRAKGDLPSAVPSLPYSRDSATVDIWLTNTPAALLATGPEADVQRLEEAKEDPAQRANREAYFSQLRDDVHAHLVQERVALKAKEERLRKEYLAIDRSWQQHCSRLQRLEERRDVRDVYPGGGMGSAPYNSVPASQSQMMAPAMSGFQRRPAMQLGLGGTPMGAAGGIGGPLSASGMNPLSASLSIPDDYVATPLSARANRRGGGVSGFPGFGDAVRSEAEFLEILATLENADMQDPNARAARTTATVPDLVLTPNDGEPMMSSYDDDNGFVADPVAFYFDEFDPDVWTEEEKAIFERKYALWPKQFGRIAAGIPGKTRAQCVRYYYLNKKQPGSNFKAIAAARSRERKKKNRVKPKKAKGSALMADLKIDDVGDDEDITESRGELADSEMLDGSSSADMSGSMRLVIPTSPPAKKRRKEDLSAESTAGKKSKGKGRRSKSGTPGEKKSKSKTGPSASAPPETSSASTARTPLISNAPPLDPIGEHEESELVAAEMLKALASIATSPEVNTTHPLPALEDVKPAAKKKRKTDSTPPELGISEPSTPAGLTVPASSSKRPRQSTSSYWSIDEKNEFLRSLAANGKEWNQVASTLQTKSAAQARNYFVRNAEDPDFIEAAKIGESNSSLDPAMREAAATAFHNRRIADGAPVGVGTGRVQQPAPSIVTQSEEGGEAAPVTHRGFRITSLLNEEPSRPASRSSSAPYSSQAGRDEYGEGSGGGGPDDRAASSRPAASSMDGDDTEDEDYGSRGLTHHPETRPDRSPLRHEATYHQTSGREAYGAYPQGRGHHVSSAPVHTAAYGAASHSHSNGPHTATGTYAYSHLPASGERTSVPTGSAMPPPSSTRRYDTVSPALAPSLGFQHNGSGAHDEADRSDYGRDSTPHGMQSPDMDRNHHHYPPREPVYSERSGHPSWSTTGPVSASHTRSSSIRYAPVPIGRGYPTQAPSQSPPPRAIHSASPVTALSSSAPPAHVNASSMQPPLNRPGYVAYRSTSASVAPSYASSHHGDQGSDTMSHPHYAHASSISRMMSRSPEHPLPPPQRASQSPAYQPLGLAPLSHGHSHPHHAHHHAHHGSSASSSSHLYPGQSGAAAGSSHPGAAYNNAPSPSAYTSAPVRVGSLPRGPISSSLGGPTTAKAGSLLPPLGSGSSSATPSSAYALSASRGGGSALPALPPIHTLGAPHRLMTPASRSSSESKARGAWEWMGGNSGAGGGNGGGGAGRSGSSHSGEPPHG
ncbi:DNA-binding protein snt1 [Tilletia horrida]|uniref:DNA-binding protein snt1 n=1 Tax=Tilletia horrida TaxID=155126 RepID=A0AAN6GRL1_9BASI|nr:DNA-binding protein snt1 [Tilletia horrida]KAK0561690.1 DNA-binding protein snt1 [Tilletia horrida]